MAVNPAGDDMESWPAPVGDGAGRRGTAAPGCDCASGASVPLAKPAQASYRRNLPHLQRRAKPIFVTFSTYKRWRLPESVRSVVLEHCLFDHGTKFVARGVVVMSDHARMVSTSLQDEDGNTFGLAQILSGIKGASAHRVNQALKRRGHVWQDESFDHVLRSNENVRNKVEYICHNPVRQGLVGSVDDYPWLWREWIEGAAQDE